MKAGLRLDIQVCIPKLFGAWNRTQDFKHAKQALYQLSDTPIPLFIVKKKILKEAKMKWWRQLFSANPGSPLNVAKTEEAIFFSWLTACKRYSISCVITNCSYSF